jgi:2-keto-4-pentenoate hydratase
VSSRNRRAAELLLATRSQRQRLASLPDDLRPLTEADAYAIQEAVVDAIGPVGGWKVGARDAAAEPTCSPLCAEWIVASPAGFASDRFARRGIEAELAFTLARDLPASGAPYGERDVVSALATVHPVIEIVDARFIDVQTVDPLSQLADSLSHGALAVGAGVPLSPSFDVARQSVEVRFGDTLEFSGVNSNAAGNPFRLLAWLASRVAARRGGLHRGDVVTTGSWSGLRFAESGARVAARFEGIGDVSVKFAQ